MMKSALTAVSAMAALMMAAPATAAPAKVDPAAAEAAARYLLPRLMDAVMVKCEPSLAADGFFAREGAAMLARYSQDADSHWPQARVALMEMGKEKAGNMDLAALPDDAVKAMFDSMLPAVLVQKIKPADCPQIERLAALLAPLPPENVAGLVRFAVEASAQKRGTKAASGK